MMDIALVCAGLSPPFVLYFFVWTRSTLFKKWCQRIFPGIDALDVFTTMAALLKVWQGTVVVLWIAWLTHVTTLAWPTLWRFVISMGILAIGQTLNVGTYNAIGKVGVYYGCRLDHKVPWCSGFPFTVCPHPQYVGSALSCWALVPLLWTPEISGSLVAISSFVTVCYLLIALVEDNL